MRSIKTLSKVLIVLSLVTCLVHTVLGQDKPAFDTVDFSKKTELADWLVRYDEVAWHTSDVVMTEDKAELAKLGKEWFCFQDKAGAWHALYGKYSDGKYSVVFHYIVDKAGKIVKTNATVDQNFANAHAKALATGRSALEPKLKTKLPFNQYIRQNPDKTFDVWLFPAFQTDGTAVFGAEGIYHIDETGSKIITDTSYFQSGLRGFKTGEPREIWLDYTDVEKPTLGYVFFVWYYKDYFTKIKIDNTKSISTVYKGDGQYLWITAEKHDKKTPDLKP